MPYALFELGWFLSVCFSLRYFQSFLCFYFYLFCSYPHHSLETSGRQANLFASILTFWKRKWICLFVIICAGVLHLPTGNPHNLSYGRLNPEGPHYGSESQKTKPSASWNLDFKFHSSLVVFIRFRSNFTRCTVVFPIE